MNSLEMLNKCTLCIRNCKVNRNDNKIGVCKASNKIMIAKAFLHLWEEPPNSMGKGSGTVFFSYCNLKCVFCQNYNISQDNKQNINTCNSSVTGKEVSIERLSEIFLELQEKGANNINLVTPTHYVPQIIKAIDISRKKGLNLPILYNTNSYDSLETIQSLNGYIDVYLPDFKYFNDKYAFKYSGAKNYAENAVKVIDEMLKQTGAPKFDEQGRIIKGVIVRHLMLPGLLFDSKKVIDLLYNRYGDNIFISIMNQYVPMFNASEYPEINKSLNPKHYESLVNYAAELGVKNGFIQEEGANTDSYTPDFNLEGV